MATQPVKAIMTTCHKVFTRLARGWGPARKENFGSGPFYDEIFERCEYLIEFKYTDGEQIKIMRGMRALESCITATEGMSAADFKRYRHLSVMKRFQFLMSDSQVTIMTQLRDEAVDDIVACLPKATGKQILKAKGKVVEDVFIVSSKIASSSSSSAKGKKSASKEEEGASTAAPKKVQKKKQDSDDEGLF